MYNRVYSFCNGNDVVNKLKETPVGTHTKKTTLTGCNTCHPGNNIYGPESSGKEAEAEHRLPRLPFLDLRLLKTQTLKG